MQRILSLRDVLYCIDSLIQMVHNAANIRKQMMTGSQVGDDSKESLRGKDDTTLASDKMRKLKPGARLHNMNITWVHVHINVNYCSNIICECQ